MNLSRSMAKLLHRIFLNALYLSNSHQTNLMQMIVISSIIVPNRGEEDFDLLFNSLALSSPNPVRFGLSNKIWFTKENLLAHLLTDEIQMNLFRLLRTMAS